MKLTDALRGEHGVLHALLAHVETTMDRTTTVGEARALAQVLAALLLSHAKLEDELLFPSLIARLGPHGPMAVMRAEHEELDEALAGAVGAPTRELVVAHLARVISLARRHLAKEERVLFEVADELIDEGLLASRGARWASERGLERLPADAPACGRRAAR